jgi:septum site-determining protein MinC
MLNVDNICDFKNEGTSLTILYIYGVDIDEIRKVLRQKKKQAKSFFESCPIVIDFENTPECDIDFILNSINVMKEEGFLPIGVKSVKSRFKEGLQALKVPIYTTSKTIEKNVEKNVENKKDSTKNIDASDIEPKRNLTKTHFESIRSGQKISAKGMNLSIFGSVNSSAEVLSSGSIVVSGSLCGKAAAGIGGDDSATIFAMKFDAALVSINGVFAVFEDGVPDEYKNKPVVVFLEDGQIRIRKA